MRIDNMTIYLYPPLFGYYVMSCDDVNHDRYFGVGGFSPKFCQDSAKTVYKPTHAVPPCGSICDAVGVSYVRVST
jgi:hypothetical protein